MRHPRPGGKRHGGTPLIAAVPLIQNSDLMYARDAKNKRDWLIDGGAFISLVPPSHAQRTKGPNGKKLCAANGTSIDCYGEIDIDIHLGSRSFKHTLLVADVKVSLLGADFLAYHYLAPNHRDRTIMDLQDLSTLDAEIVSSPSLTGHNSVNHVSPSSSSDIYSQLLTQYPDITAPNFKLTEVDHGVEHRIPTNGHPIKSKARRLAPEKLAEVKAELEKYVELGIARRSKSEYSSPLLVTPKPDGSWRVCGDYRRLNCQTEDDHYPVRNISDFNADLSGKTVFSKVDLLKGYHQIPVAQEDIRKTAVITPFGLYEFPRTPFGLKTAGQSFQRLMDSVLADIPHVFVYLDDVLVASSSPEEHLEDLQRLFDRLQENALVINAKKCLFGQSSLDFLGYKVDASGIYPMEDRVQAIRKQEPPTTIKELQRFLGMVNYYRRFIPRAAHHLYALFEALKSKTKNLQWSEACQKSFEAVKSALSAATLLHHPRHGAHLAITTDASKVALGAVLEQRGPKGWEPLAFFSAKLSADKPNQQLWPPFDRELLGVFRAVRHFRHMVEGRPFTIFTDQQALVPALHKKAEPLTARQAYQLSCVAEMTTDIRYIQGKANFVADALSRPVGSDIASIQPQDIHLFIACIQQHRLPDISLLDRNQSQALEAQRRVTLPKGSPATKDESLNPTSSGSPTNSLSLPDLSSNPAAQCLDDLPSQSSASACRGQLPLQRTTSSASSRSQTRVFTPISHIDRPIDQSKKADLDTLVSAISTFDIDIAKLATEQPLDADFRRLSDDPQSGLSLRKVDIGNRDLLVDVSNGTPRPFVPFGWRRKIFDAVHGLGHPGVHRTQQMMVDRFIWPSIKADSARWARECIPCQQAKISRHVVPPIGHFEVPTRRFSHLNVDLVTLSPSNGYNHLLTIVDRFSRWPAAIPISNISAETVADAFAHGWVAHYGVPVAITTDRGSQFSSSIWTQLMEQWGIRPLMTTAYHPEANGMVERLHRRLKEAILALCPDAPQQWYWKLPMALLAIRTTLKPDIGASPADLVFGEGLALPGNLVQAADPADDNLQRRQASTLANLRLEVARLQPTQTSAHRTPRVFIPENMETTSHVFVRRGGVQSTLSTPYEGPYRVTSRTPTGYRVRLPGGRTELIALNRLKPAFVSGEDVPGEEPPDLDNSQPPSPPPPGRRPGVRTRTPAPTTRQTRSTSRRAQQQQQPQQQQPRDPAQAPGIPHRAAARSNPQPDWPAAARPPLLQPPPTTIRREKTSSSSLPKSIHIARSNEQRRTLNIDEFLPPSSLGPARDTRRDVQGSENSSLGPARTNPSRQDDAETSAKRKPSTTTPAVPSRDELSVDDEEPMRETNFFAPLQAATSSDGDIDRTEQVPPRLTSALRTNQTPSGARVRFSDERHRDPQPRHYFSDQRRPRPDVSAITTRILAHLHGTSSEKDGVDDAVSPHHRHGGM